ncbi:hypothetical protein N658DRAFT_183366 [Parathielavia hyrcaniae]|uniref:Uncharacterized protein n=1 Tax=Parathielavia hyrcaniae TaxID=113614 RepID=A0AAN6Q6T5_9PEZI|nr:hypothetical protein N658DRAFT_183366 [Parathielavia hyrcaniae]
MAMPSCAHQPEARCSKARPRPATPSRRCRDCLGQRGNSATYNERGNPLDPQWLSGSSLPVLNGAAGMGHDDTSSGGADAVTHLERNAPRIAAAQAGSVNYPGPQDMARGQGCGVGDCHTGPRLAETRWEKGCKWESWKRTGHGNECGLASLCSLLQQPQLRPVRGDNGPTGLLHVLP